MRMMTPDLYIIIPVSVWTALVGVDLYEFP
jgi:hypothetical protein